MKACTVCKQNLENDAFRPDPRLRSGLSSACKNCLCLRSKVGRNKYKKRIKEYMVAWHEKNKKKNSETHKRWLTKNKFRCKAHSCNNIAKRRFGVEPIPNDLLVELMAQGKGLCGYCGSSKSVGFDHRVPMYLGGKHELTNLILCCVDCNRTKGKLTEAKFRTKCARLGIILNQ